MDANRIYALFCITNCFIILPLIIDYCGTACNYILSRLLLSIIQDVLTVSHQEIHYITRFTMLRNIKPRLSKKAACNRHEKTKKKLSREPKL